MKQMLTSFRILATIALLALAVGCSNLPSKQKTLVAAGFRVSVPKTAAQQQKLKSLPPDKVSTIQKDGKTYTCSRMWPTTWPTSVANKRRNLCQIRRQEKKAEEIQWKENAEQIEWGGWGS